MGPLEAQEGRRGESLYSYNLGPGYIASTREVVVFFSLWLSALVCSSNITKWGSMKDEGTISSHYESLLL